MPDGDHSRNNDRYAIPIFHYPRERHLRPRETNLGRRSCTPIRCLSQSEGKGFRGIRKETGDAIAGLFTQASDKALQTLGPLLQARALQQ